MNNKDLRILIVGGGSIGRRHLKNLQFLGYGKIAVLKRAADPKFATEHQVTVLTSFTDAEAFNPEIVFACNPTALHNECLEFAVKKGCHLFMEKPLIHDQIGLVEAIGSMENYSKIFFIGFMLRFHPLVIQLKQLLDDHILGKVHYARFEFGSYLPYWHPWEDYKISYASKKSLGGGVINTITHELDLIQYFFDSPRQVFCEASNFSLLNIEVEEQCDALFQYSDKTVALHLDYLQKDYDRTIKIMGEEGKLTWNWHDNYITLSKHKEESILIDLDAAYDVNNLYIDELKYFFTLVADNQRQHALDFNHAVRNTELMLLMHKSADQGKKIPYNATSTPAFRSN